MASNVLTKVLVALLLLALSLWTYFGEPITEPKIIKETLTKTITITNRIPVTVTYTTTTYTTIPYIMKSITTTKTPSIIFNKKETLVGGYFYRLKPRLSPGETIHVEWSSPYSIYVYIQRPEQFSQLMCIQYSYLVRGFDSSGHIQYTADKEGEYYVIVCHPWWWASFDANIKVWIERNVRKIVTLTRTKTSPVRMTVVETRTKTLTTTSRKTTVLSRKIQAPSILNVYLAAALMISAIIFPIAMASSKEKRKAITKGREVRPIKIIEIDNTKKYGILTLIGKGGFSEVYKAIKYPENVTVALKIPKAITEGTITDELAKVFEKEASLWKSLKHDNIVKVFDYGIKPFPYVAMEYMDGGSLRKILSTKKRLPYKEAINIILQISQALKYVHSRRIVHRDIKPENILFDSKGNAKLTDFGIAKVFASLSTSTSTKVFKGTLAYAAPEQISPKKFGEIDYRTDIYQLSVVLYELLTGKLPFEAEDIPELLNKILYEKPTPPSSHNPQLPHILDKIVLKGLEKRKEERWKSIDEFIEALTKFAHEESRN